MSNSVKAIIVFVFGCMLLTMVEAAKADPLQLVDDILHTTKQPIRDVAAVTSLVVSFQTDVLGKDDVRTPIDIRQFSEPVNRISHVRNRLANACSNASVTLKKELCWR